MARSKLLTLSVITAVVATSPGVMAIPAMAAQQSSVAVPQTAQPAFTPTSETSCGLLVLNGSSTEVKPYPKLHVLNAKSINMPKIDSNVLGVTCTRDSVIPVASDSVVLKKQSKPFILSDGVRTGTLTLEKGKYRFAVSGGVLTKLEEAEVKVRIKDMNAAEAKLAQKKSTGSKAASCVGMGILGALAGALIAGKKDRGAGAVAGFAIGCAAGWGFASKWSKTDKDGLDTASQQALDDPNGTMDWKAPESGAQVRFRTASAGEKNEDVEFEHLDSVEAPPEGSRVVSRPFRTVARVALRSAPDRTISDNIVGRFNTGQTVEIVGITPDGQWALVGEDGVIVGYSAREGFSEILQPSRLVRTERHYIETTAPPKKSIGKGKGGRARVPVLLVQAAPPVSRSQVKTTKVAATTQCKSLIAASGNANQSRTGCNRPGGKWVIA